MQDHTESRPDTLTDNVTHGGNSVEERFNRAVRRMDKRKQDVGRKPLKGMEIEKMKERMSKLYELAKLGMSAEQIVDYLDTINAPLSRTQVYEYLASMKLPRYYRKSEREQSHHDYFTFRFFIRIAEDIKKAGFFTRKILKGKLPWPEMRFRPDFLFWVKQYLFLIELQLSDLTETLWSVKFNHYAKLRVFLGHTFRALFIIDQRGDLAYIRRAATRYIERHKRYDLESVFLFIRLDDLKSSQNVATDPIWLTPSGQRVTLLQYL